MKVIAADVAARLGMQTRKAAAESHTTTGEMASAKAAHMSAAEAAADMTASAEAAAHMTAAAEPAPVSTSTSTSPAAAAARKRVGGQPSGESGSRQQHDHGLT
jgi:hypothetical protein